MFLHEQFPDRWIGHCDPIKCAPRSPDLTSFDFFFWGYIKSKVYGTSPRDLLSLEERIRNTCASVTPEMLPDVGQACVKRWLDCYEKDGAHVEVYH